MTSKKNVGKLIRDSLRKNTLETRAITQPNHTTEMVNHPKHYGDRDDPYETIKVAEAKLLPDEVVGAYKFQIQTYLDRHRRKNGFEDLLKAHWYMNRLIQYIETRGFQNMFGP